MDVMLDLETAGTRKTSAITQIGVVTFDKAFGLQKPNKPSACVGRSWNINLQSSLMFGFTIDDSTTKWWRTQSVDAKLALTGTGQYYSLPDALNGLRLFLEEQTFDNVWAHGPSFDIALLEHAFEKLSIETPWAYNAPRDTRTLFDLAQETGWEKRERSELSIKASANVEHNSLDDAIYQAACVQSAYAALWG